MGHMTLTFSGELKLVSNCILQAPEMLRQGFYSQVSIGSSIAKPSNILKRCYYSLHLLIVLLVPPVNLVEMRKP